jgi:hypothetical protein
MHFQRTHRDGTLGSTLAAFDCKWCGVVLRVAPQAEFLELAAPALVPG